MSAVWLNGALLDAAAARIDPADRGFTLGDGVFETIRAAAGEPVWLDQHLSRLHDGARVLGIGVPYGESVLYEAMLAVLRAHAWQDAALRLTLTRGPAPRGVLPAGGGRATVLITAAPLPAPLPPARVIVATRTRRNEHSPLARIKSLNYLDSVIARQEAEEHGADDAILLNTRGMVAEATSSTVVILHGGRLVTPCIDDGALPGIARGLLVESGSVAERSVPPADLLAADALCLVNSLGVRAVASVNGVALQVDHPDMAPIQRARSGGLRPASRPAC